MSAKELRGMSDEDLQTQARKLRDEVTQLNMKRHTRRLDKSSELQAAKRDLARVLTILNEKSRTQAGGAN